MSDWQSYIIFAAIIILLFWILTRGRRRGGSSGRLQTAIAVISNVNDNLKIMENHITNKESTKKFKTRIVIEFERPVKIRKYDRYAKKKTKLHAHLPECMTDKIEEGDYVRIKECRPISKLIHFVLMEKIR